MPWPSHVPFTAAWWLPGPHLATIWGRLLRRVTPVQTCAYTLDTPDGDFLEVRRLAGKCDSPRLVILHGLEGSPRSHYVRAFFAEAARRGWSADLLVFRSCGSGMNRGRRFYHSGETADLSQVVTWLLTERPGVPILLAGVSLGGNVLLKWLGEQGDALPPEVAGAVAISVPFDLARSSRKIGAGFSRLYERVFLSTLRAKALHIRERFPDLLSGVDIGRISSMWEFDDVVTAPVHGFENADDYYARCSSIRWIARIRVPTLLLSAADDPFLPPEVLAGVQRIADENHFLRTEFPERGGHVGFIGGKNPFRPYYYAEWRACAFLEQPGPGLRRENAQITDIG